LGLGAYQPGQTCDDSQVVQHFKTLANGADISQVASRNDDEVRDFTIELLVKLKADGFLSFDTERVHGVRQINIVLGAHFLNHRHAPVEIGIQGKGQHPMSDGLNQLRQRNLIFR